MFILIIAIHHQVHMFNNRNLFFTICKVVPMHKVIICLRVSENYNIVQATFFYFYSDIFSFYKL